MKKGVWSLKWMGTLPCLWAIFTMGKNFCDFLFASLDEEDPWKWGLLLKKKICSCRSKFFPFRVYPFEKGDLSKNNWVASP